MIKLNLQAEMPLAPMLAMSLDKDAESFGQSGINPRNDFFDQYLTFDAVDADSSKYLSAPESMFLVSQAKGSESTGASIKLWKDEAAQDLAPRSRGELSQQESAALFHDKLTGDSYHWIEPDRAVGPDLELLSLDKISLHSPRLKTPPSSPESLVTKKTRARQRILEGFHRPFQNERENAKIRKSTSPIRKATCAAEMRRSHHGDENVHNWDQQLASDASDFDFGFQNTSLSPPSSGRVSESSEGNVHMIAAPQQNDSSYAWDYPVPEQYIYRNTEDLEPPFTTPPANTAFFHHPNRQNASANNMIYTTSHRNQSSAPWTQAPVSAGHAFEASTPYLEQPDTPIWWGNAATTPLLEPAPSAYRRQNLQNTQSLAMELQAELAFNSNELALSPSNTPSGLMIRMPNTPTGQSFVVGTSPMDSKQGYLAPAAASPPFQPHYAQQYTQSQTHSYAQLPNRQEKSRTYPRSHSRTESFASSPSPRSHASSMHVSKKTRSSSRKRAGEGGQKTQKGTVAVVGDFVNFTPKDSNKILTGVAPSGSSKTKARREKEAAEKTRRLSQAAVRAVQAAGGSIDALVEEGVFDGSDLEEMS